MGFLSKLKSKLSGSSSKSSSSSSSSRSSGSSSAGLGAIAGLTPLGAGLYAATKTLTDAVSSRTGSSGSSYVAPAAEVNPYDSMIAETQRAYAEQLAKQEEAKRLAVNQGVDTLNSQKSTINQGFDDSARQAYISSMQAKKALPEQLANQGITGGASETSNLQLQTGYENNLNDINTNRQNTLNGIDTSINQLKNTGNLEIAQLGAQNAQDAMTAYQTLMKNKLDYGLDQQKYATEQEKQYKTDYDASIKAYYGDYQARINELINQGYAKDSYEVLQLEAAREDKLKELADKKTKQDQLDKENAIKEKQLALNTKSVNYTTGKPYTTKSTAKTASTKPLTFSQQMSNLSKLHDSGYYNDDQYAQQAAVIAKKYGY